MKFYTTSKISENLHKTPEGYLVCVGVPIARTGEMIYGEGETPLEADETGKVIVSRDAKEVFRAETIASFEGKSFTILHPEDFVDPTNWKELTTGVLQNIRRGKGEQENDLVADILITDSVAIDLVETKGLREVSCGYEANYTQTGIGRGFQSEIIGNHLALVQEGRAGSSYAINDHKGKDSAMKLSDKIKAVFAKAQDEALKAAGEVKDMNTETPEVKTGFVSYDDFKKAMDDFGSKMDAFMGKKGGDASTQPGPGKPAEVEAKDEEKPKEEEKKSKDEEHAGLEGRLAKLEEMMAKYMKANDAYDDDEEVTDEDEEKEESEDDDYEESTMVGDTASRIEILAPGMKVKGKDAKGKALLAAYATEDGKKVINQFTGGKAPNVKDEKLVDAVFIGASEVLKVTRKNELASTRTRDLSANPGDPKKIMSAEELNKINEKHYASKK